MALRFRTLGHVSLAVIAILAAACGDDSDGTTSGGGSGGGTTSSTATTTTVASTTTTTTSTSSTQSGGGEGGSGDGGSNQGGGGSGQGGDPSVGGSGQGGDPSVGGSGQGGDPGVGGAGGVPVEPAAIYASSNPTGRDGDGIQRIDLSLTAAESTFGGLGDILSLQNVTLDGTGDGWITYDAPGATGGVMFVTDLESLANATSLGGGTSRVEGPATGLVTPKGVKYVADLDLLLVADTTSRTVSAFAPDDEGDVAPLFVVDQLGLAGRAVWDVAYDASNDILYAAGTDGVVVAFDGFSTDNGQDGPSRTITPSVNGSKISVNLHGIDVVDGGILDPAVLVLTDVGDPAITTDGQLLTIANPDQASGATDVRGRVLGATSLLGNPVDVQVRGGSAYIAEKSNDRLLRYDNIAALTSSGDLAASASVTTTKPESVAAGASLLDNIHVINNPAGRDLDALTRYDALLVSAATIGTPGVLQSIQSLVLDEAGNGFATVDLALSRGSILVVDDLAASASGTPIARGSRRIEGDATGLIAPKGLRIADINGQVLLVADTGGTARDVKAFAIDGEGDVAPLFTVSDLGADRAPWDLDYDAAADRLYVACTDGVVVVYDLFSATLGAAGPDREITPAVGGTDVSTNLHGIAFLPDSGYLVVSDVGDAAVATDGRIYTIADGATANGLVDVRARISGADTLLGNPVDVTVANGSVYVAEKSNDRVIRYLAIEDLVGEITTAPDSQLAVVKPESVFVRFE